eukprot:127040_1
MHPLQSLQTLPPKPTQKLPTTHPPTWITNKNGNRDVRNPKESILIQIPPQILILPPIHLLLIHDPDLDPKKSKKKRKRKHRKRSSSYSSDESRTKHRKKSRRDRGSRRKRSRSRSYSSRSRSRGRSYSRSASRDKMGGNKPYNPSSRYTENAEYGYNDNNYGDSSYSRYGGGGGSGGFGGGRGGYRGYNGRGGGNNYYGGGGSGGSYGSRGSSRWTREERENPPQGRVLGCFGLSQRTAERDLRNVFERYGEVEKVMLIIDRKTQISKGYAFIYFAQPMDASKAKEACTGIELDGRPIRVDFSLTKRPHSPTPGTYLGRRYPGRGGYGGPSNSYSSYGMRG